MGQASHEPSMEDILASIKRIIAEDSEAVGARPARLRREAINAVQSSPAITRGPDVRGPDTGNGDPEVDSEGLPEDQTAADQAALKQAWAKIEKSDVPDTGKTDGAPQSQPEQDQVERDQVEPAEPAATLQEDGVEGEADPAIAAASTEEPERAPEDILELTSTMSEAKSEAQENDDMPATKPTAITGGAPNAGPNGLVSGQAATASRNAFAALSQLQVRTEEGESNTLEGLVGDLLRPMLREWLDRELPPLVERVVTAEVRRLSGGMV